MEQHAKNLKDFQEAKRRRTEEEEIRVEHVGAKGGEKDIEDVEEFVKSIRRFLLDYKNAKKNRL